MWERFRTGTGGAPGHDSSTPGRQQQQHQGQRLPPSSTNFNTNSSNIAANPSFSNSNSHNYSNSSNSWQPRSSVIAQRQRQQQPQNRQHHQQQQQLRSASADNYPGSGSAGGYGGYQYSIKGGPPPPRPLRDLCVASCPPPPSKSTRLPSPLPKCLRHQLTHPRAILAKYRRLSNLLAANRPSPNSHNNDNNNANCTRPVPTRDTTPATPSPAARPRLSTPSPRRCIRPLRPSATDPTSRDTNPTALTTSLPRAPPSCYLPEMCTSSPSLLRRESTLRRGTASTGGKVQTT